MYDLRLLIKNFIKYNIYFDKFLNEKGAMIKKN